MTRNWSLARRLIIGAAVWSLIMMVVTASVLTAINRNQTLQLLQDDLDSTLTTLTRAANVDEDNNVTMTGSYAPSDERYGQPLSGRYWIVARLSEAGEPQVWINSNSVWDWDIPWERFDMAFAAQRLGKTQYVTTRGPDKEPLRAAVKAIVLPGQETPVALIAAIDRRPTDRIIRNFLISLTVAMLALAVGLIFAMVIQVRIGLRPLTRIEHDISDIRAGEKMKLDEDYPLEVAPLAVEVNKLLEHNRSVVERARTHVGNLAHALKTPIAVLMNEARGDDAFSGLVRRQTEAMSQNVQHYLKRAQAAARAEVLSAKTEISPAIDDLTRLLGRLYQDQGISVAPGAVDESAAFRGERQDLDEMLGNLLENACKFAQTKVRISARIVPGGEVVIHVDDDGPGLTPEEREQALKRGVRLDETAPGTGLGLSIVKDLAELYSGRFNLEDSPLGGLRASLVLPGAAGK